VNREVHREVRRSLIATLVLRLMLRVTGRSIAARLAARLLLIARRAVVLTGDPAVTYTIGGRSLLLPASHDLPIYQRDHPEYSENLGWIAGLMLATEPDLRIIDVGANVGDGVAIIRQYGDAPVLCVDGDDAFFRYLEANAFHLEGTTLAKAFVGEHRSIVVGHVSVDSGTARVRYGAGGGSISIVTLPDVLADHPEFAQARLLKIDTDGMDTAVLFGATPYLRQAKPVVFFEYDPDLTAEAGDDPRRALGLLGDLGYRHMLVFENTGRYMCSLDLSDSGLLDDLHLYFSGHRGARYADLCAFPDRDEELWRLARDEARKKGRSAGNHG